MRSTEMLRWGKTMTATGGQGPGREGPDAPRIALIIPVKNEERRLPTCMNAIRAQTRQPDEIIVVDGHSKDGTVELAKKFGTRVFFEEYRTRAGACQVGVENTTAELVAFTDADCVPEPGWLETLAANLAPGVAGVGGRIENKGNTFTQRSVDAALDTAVGSANSVQGRPFATPRYVKSISGCNSLYRRSDLLDAGGFDTELVTTEDTELNRRMLRRGKLLYVPSAVVEHRHERGLRAFARRMLQYGYGRGQSLLFGPPLFVSLGAVVVLGLALVRPWAGLLLIGLYGALLLVTAAVTAVRKHDARYLASVPAVLVIEHVCYVAGFWHGILHSRLHLRRRAPRAQEDAT